MSRGFVKEEDQEETPIIPPRAALPAGITNYVTPSGKQALLTEKKTLENAQTNLPHDNDTERRRMSMIIDGKLRLLHQRIRSARVINLRNQPHDEVRFGAKVMFLNGKRELEFQLVGVDEADVNQQKIAFTAPIARALIGHKRGETVAFNRGEKTQQLRIKKITYPADNG